jgi:hypothetical protein
METAKMSRVHLCVCVCVCVCVAYSFYLSAGDSFVGRLSIDRIQAHELELQLERTVLEAAVRPMSSVDVQASVSARATLSETDRATAHGLEQANLQLEHRARGLELQLERAVLQQGSSLPLQPQRPAPVPDSQSAMSASFSSVFTAAAAPPPPPPPQQQLQQQLAPEPAHSQPVLSLQSAAALVALGQQPPPQQQILSRSASFSSFPSSLSSSSSASPARSRPTTSASTLATHGLATSSLSAPDDAAAALLASAAQVTRRARARRDHEALLTLIQQAQEEEEAEAHAHAPTSTRYVRREDEDDAAAAAAARTIAAALVAQGAIPLAGTAGASATTTPDSDRSRTPRRVPLSLPSSGPLEPRVALARSAAATTSSASVVASLQAAVRSWSPARSTSAGVQTHSTAPFQPLGLGDAQSRNTANNEPSPSRM